MRIKGVENCGSCVHGLKCLQASACMREYMLRPDAPPRDWDELMMRQVRNTNTVGYGLETAMEFACPGCGAAGFMRTLVLECDKVYQRGSVCKECERGFRFPVHRDGHSIGVSFEQTSGPDLPDWFKLRIPRAQVN